MKTHVRLLTLASRWSSAVFVASWGMTPDAFAQPGQSDTGSVAPPGVAASGAASLDAVTVTGSRAPRLLSELPTSVTQVEREELAQQLRLTTNILQSLETLVPGLAPSTDYRGVGTCTSIRGRTVQLLVNGVPTNDSLRTSNCRGIASISPFAIERVEVVRGGTALFGTGAPGGIINVITRRAQGERLEVDAVAQYGANTRDFGDTRELNAYLGAGQTFSQGDYYAGLAWQDLGARRNPDGGLVPGQTERSWTFNTSIGLKLAEGTLRFTGSWYRRNPGTDFQLDGTQVSGQRFADNVIVGPKDPFDSEAHGRVALGTLSYQHPDVIGNRLDASIYVHDESNIQRASEVYMGQTYYTDSDQQNRHYGLRTALTREFAVGTGNLEATYGVDLLRQYFYRPFVDPATDRTVTGFLSPEVTLDSTALFLQPQYRYGPLLINGGVRHERFRGRVGDKDFDAALPGAAEPGRIPTFNVTLYNAGVVYDLQRNLQLYGGFSQGAEIAELGRAARGSTDPRLIKLDGANSDQYEVGVRGTRGVVDFSASLFYSKSKEAAELAADASCAGEPVCPLISVRAQQTVHGVEGTLDWRATSLLKLGGILTWQKGKYRQEDEPTVALDSGTASPLRLTAYFDLKPLPAWGARVQATYTAKTHSYDADEEAQGYLESPTLFLLDATIDYQLGPGKFALGIANLLDRRYVNIANNVRGDFFYYRSEGRRATISYTARF